MIEIKRVEDHVDNDSTLKTYIFFTEACMIYNRICFQ